MKKLSYSHSYLLLFPILIGLAFIWYKLDLRVLHHDESLHAIYGLYFYLDPTKQFYKYDPMLHGPLLYYLLPWVYHLFDESHLSIRFLSAFLFSIIPLGVFVILRKRIGWLSLAIAAFLITGPSYIYWARFLRHDQLVIFLFLIMGISFHIKNEKIRPYLFFSALSLQFCVKENSYIHLSFWLGFYLFFYLVEKKVLTSFNSLFKFKKHLLFSFLLGAFIYSFYYSAGFNYSKGIIDGLYRKSISYWLTQHKIERISGPFLTQFFTLFWYELPFTLLLIVTTFKLHWNETKKLRYLPFLVLLLGLLFHLSYGHSVASSSIWNKFIKLKLGIDFYGFFSLTFLAVSGTWILIKKNEKLSAFFYYWTFASFFTYSFLGEKVPWLSIYILIPGVVFLGIYYRKAKGALPALVLSFSIVFNIYQAYQLNFKKMGAETEFISQVHTTKEYEDLAKKLSLLLDKDSNKKVLALKNNTWPLTWYLYGKNGYYFHQMGKEFTEFDVVLDGDFSKIKLENYTKRKIALRHWWVPDWRKMSIVDFISYSFNHKPWNSPGSQKIALFYKNGLLDF